MTRGRGGLPAQLFAPGGGGGGASLPRLESWFVGSADPLTYGEDIPAGFSVFAASDGAWTLTLGDIGFENDGLVVPIVVFDADVVTFAVPEGGLLRHRADKLPQASGPGSIVFAYCFGGDWWVLTGDLDDAP